MNEEQKEVSKHYSATIRIPLTDQQRIDGIIDFKLDPYRILKTYQINNPAIEHVVKKGLRWTSKGHEPRKVINEMIATLQRELEIMNESLLVPGRSLADILKDRDSTKVETQGFSAPRNSAGWHVTFNWVVDNVRVWGSDIAPDGWYWSGDNLYKQGVEGRISKELWEEARKAKLSLLDTNGLLGNDPRS